MRNKTVNTDNLRRFQEAYRDLISTPISLPKLCLVHGRSGYGKTHAVSWLAVQQGAIYVRASTLWTPKDMLVCILRELGCDVRGHSQALLERALEALMRQSATLFIDEFDHVVDSSSSRKMVETIRYLHDMGDLPIIMVGEDEVKRKLSRWARFSRRVAQEVEFAPGAYSDTEKLASECCEVAVEGDLLGELHKQAQGSVGNVLVGLARIEAQARRMGLEEIGREQWREGNQNFFLKR